MQSLFKQETALTFLMVLARVGGLFVASPIFSSRSMPAKIKILFSLAVSFMVFPSIKTIDFIPDNMIQLLFAIAGQVAFGMLVGLAVSLLFAAIQAGGSLIDFIVGFSMSAALDPTFGDRSTLVSRWYNFTALMIFFFLGGHYWLILGFINSFKIVPLDRDFLTPGMTFYIVRSFSDILKIAFNTAAPVFIAVILVDIAAGFVAKTAPKLNIMFVSFPFKIALGFFVLGLTMTNTFHVFSIWLSELRAPLLKFFYL